MIKRTASVLLFFGLFCLYPADLPQPKNDQLYTEYTSFRSASYLKRSIESSGYIAMNGRDNFVFAQNDPVKIVIKRTKDILTYSRNNMEPVAVDSVSNSIVLLFGEPSKLSEKYKIDKSSVGNVDQYVIIPKEKDDEIDNIIIIGVDDKIEIINILFKNKTRIEYKFRNTVTGVKPDEKYF